MPYRRAPMRRRPYYGSEKPPAASVPQEAATAVPFPEGDRIPLPTEEERIPLPGGNSSAERKGISFLNMLPFKIGMEEILLFGLIFVLFQEGINDDILILLLLYVLFTGLE